MLCHLCKKRIGLMDDLVYYEAYYPMHINCFHERKALELQVSLVLKRIQEESKRAHRCVHTLTEKV